MAGIIRRNSAGAKWIYHNVAKRDQDQLNAMHKLVREWRELGYSDAEIVKLGKAVLV